MGLWSDSGSWNGSTAPLYHSASLAKEKEGWEEKYFI